MPQLSYSQNAIIGMPGQPFDGDIFSQDRVSRVCSQVIPFGSYCEFDSNGNAQLLQDTGTTSTFLPETVGIAILNPFADEEDYVPWSVPVTLAGTVTLTNNSTAITFSTAQTLKAGVQLTFSDQPGVIYFLATALTAGTAGVLTAKYTGTGGSGKTTVEKAGDGTAAGYKIGRVGTFMRRGRIWALGDGGGTPLLYGAINVNHSSTGAHAQGVFTFTAPQTTAGNEIDVAPNVIVYQPPGSGSAGAASQVTDSLGNLFSLYPVEISL